MMSIDAIIFNLFIFCKCLGGLERTMKKQILQHFAENIAEYSGAESGEKDRRAIDLRAGQKRFSIKVQNLEVTMKFCRTDRKMETNSTATIDYVNFSLYLLTIWDKEM